MSSALVTTSALLRQLQEGLATVRRHILFVAGGPHASGDARGTLAMGFDYVFIGEGEYSFTQFLHRLMEERRDVQDIPGIAFLTDDSTGKPHVVKNRTRTTYRTRCSLS